MSDSHRYLGLELAGAKNQKTAIAVLEYYRKEGKLFLLDIHDRIHAERGEDAGPAGAAAGDSALLEVLEELKPGTARMGVNVPLEFPPCLSCTKKSCNHSSKCTVPAVRWMHSATRKAARSLGRKGVREFTPYTQRPVELYVRYQVLPKLPETHRFEIDEALGGNKAPLTARMSYLKRHLGGFHLVEVWPKLSVAILALELGLSRRTVQQYRHLEQGSHFREEILEALVSHKGVFIYERDVRKLAHSLAAFDAFICAYTALLSDLDACTAPPAGFPVASGWVEFPERRG